MRKTYKILFFLLILFFPLNIKAADRVHFTNIYEFGTPGGSGSSSGEATLVESNGHYGLVDTGNPHNSSDPYYQTQLNGKTIAAYLKANGCTHLDFVLVTHAHSDHVGGIPYLYSAGYINNKTTFIYKEFQSDNTTEGSSWNTKKYFNNAKSTMQSAGAKMLEVSTKTGLSSLNAKYTNNGGKATDYIEFSFQNFNIKIFNLYYAAKNESENHNSLVVLISKDSQKILLKSELGIPVSGSDTSREQNIASYIGKVQLARVGHYTSKYLSLHFLDKTNPDILVLLANNAKSGETYTQNNDITIGYAFMNSKSSGKTIGIIDQANPMVFQVNSSSIAMYNNKNGSLTTLTKTLNSKVKNGWYSIKDKSPTAENWIYIKDSKILKGVQKLPISDNSSRNAYFYLQSKSTASVSAGVMRTGWQTVNNKTYYLNPSTSGNKVKGEALTGWQQIQRSGTNYWYYFDGTGKMKTGWQQINGAWYYLAEEADMFTDFKYKGAMVKGLKTVPYENKNYKYYFDDSGAMKTGWIKVGNYWYYFATSASEFSGFNTGSAVTGIKTINGKTYCFNNKSQMATNTNVNHYSCNADGIATIWKIKVTTKWLEQSTNKVLATAETKTYNYGQSYTTTKKTINGYDYISSTNNTSGAAKGNSNGETITVTYYYKKYGTYSIAYNLNGGTVSGNPTIYERTTASFTLKNPTKTGYTFAGWTGTGLSAKTKTVKIASGSSGNRTYTANWTPNKIYIRFNMNGGSLSSTHGAEYSTSGSYVTRNGSLNVQTLSYGASLSSNGLANYNNKNYINIVKTGYTAVSKAEWKTKDGSKTYDQSAVYKASDFCNAGSSNCTVDLYVNWKATAYKITYALNNGTVSGNPATYYITSNDITLNNPTRAGYTFAGWTGTGLSTITKIVTIAKGSTGNRSYTANWTPNTYTISYELNGGSDPGNPTKYKVDSADITLKKPTRAGYTFVGWTGSNGETAQTTVTIAKGSTGNKNYIANWVAIDYKITYDLNGGTVSGNPNSYNILCDDIILNNPTKDGYTFVGWTGSNG
ncbi:MAG: InlB B-repeat-containing protein, partial [Clostridia bacterium]|nr:InlB B-repeat-containing protein [Clostridia bacterium]